MVEGSSHNLDYHIRPRLHTTSNITHRRPSALPRPSLTTRSKLPQPTLITRSTLPQPSFKAPSSTLPQPSLTTVTHVSILLQPSLTSPHYFNHHSPPHYLNFHSQTCLHTTSTITHRSTLPRPSLTTRSTLPQPSFTSPSTLPQPSLTLP